MEQEQAKFEGWALLELFGHGREAGYVTTAYFGGTALFRVDVPEVPARQETADRPRWMGNKLCPIGTVVEAEAVPGRTCYLGPGSIFRISPSSEEAVRAVAARVDRDVKIVSLPAGAQLTEGEVLPGESPDEEDDEDDLPI